MKTHTRSACACVKKATLLGFPPKCFMFDLTRCTLVFPLDPTFHSFQTTQSLRWLKSQMDRDDTGSPQPPLPVEQEYHWDEWTETLFHKNHHECRPSWKTHADVRSVDIKIQAVFTAHKIKGVNVEGKLKSLRLKTNVSMYFRLANRWSSMNWWLRGLIP